MRDQTEGKKINIVGRTAAALLAVLLLIACAAGPVLAQEGRHPLAGERRVVRVAFPVLDGFTYYDQYGNHCGLVVDYLNEISKYTNWQYEYIDASYDSMVKDFMNGEFDLMGGNYYSPGMERYFAYPDYNIGNGLAVLLRRADDDTINSYDLRSLNGKTIGVYDKAEEKIRLLKQFLNLKGIQCELKYYTFEQMDKSQTLYSYLKNGEVDMLLGNEAEGDDGFCVVTSFDAQPLYIVAQSGDTELLDGLNMALKHINESNPDFAKEVREKNFADNRMRDFQLRPEEKDYIKRRDAVTVAVAREGHPFYCADSHSGHHEGIVPDMLQRISEWTGLRFTIIEADTYEKAVGLVQSGEADLLGNFMDPESAADGRGLVLTRPYTEMNNIIVKNKFVNFPGGRLTGATIAGRVLPENLEAYQEKHYSTLLECVKAVDRGEVDYVYALSSSLETIIQGHYFPHVTSVTLVNNNMPVTFALARPAEPVLLDILNKSIGNFSDEEQNLILNRNLTSTGYTSLSLRELIYAYPVAFVSVIVLFFAVIIAALLLITRAKLQNSEMEGELRRAEAESVAKGEFLSRMSHEIRTPMNAIVGLTDLTCMMEDTPEGVRENLGKIRLSAGYLLSLINDILDMSRLDNDKLTIASEPFSLNELLSDLAVMMQAQAEQRGVRFELRKEVVHDWLIGDQVRLRQVLLNLLTNALKFTGPGGFVRLAAEEAPSGGGPAEYKFSVRDTGVGIAKENQQKIFDTFEQFGTNSAKSQGTGLGLPISRSIVRLMGGDIEVESAPGEGSEFFFTVKFPAGEERQKQASDIQADSLAGMRALVAEDNDLNAEIAMALLEVMGMESERASNGQEAVDMFLQREPGYYDIILMDIQMPVKNGLEATREIRGESRSGGAVPIVAMTANSFKEDVEAAKEAGVTAFIPKPVDSALLFQVMRESIHVEKVERGES